MIEIKEITKAYGSRSIIHNWQYRFENGKIYGLIGRNGIGKTTLMKCICGLEEPDSMELLTDQGDVSGLDYLTRNIYYVSDEPAYYNDLTLYEHLWIVCKAERYKKSEATGKIRELVTNFRMEEYLGFFPYALSKGTLQRMMLMFAFLRKTRNILLDEPFNGLDPIQLEQSLEYCRAYREEKCIVISSHDIESLEAVCDCFLIFTKDGIIAIDEKIDRARVNALIGDSYA
ncbi:MAG: ABC transporter ATP-binding protein [Lachnospiraceae bacterium]|nr:ABC transporter ATP-binding protein [Lachnospiraceae bacterium]